MAEKDMGMDKVDEKQQQEIDGVRHAVIGLGIVAFLILVFAVIIATNREINCPHSECPHSVLKAAQGE